MLKKHKYRSNILLFQILFICLKTNFKKKYIIKKKLLGAIFALAVMVAAGYGVNKSMSNDADLSDMALSNVEALAWWESGEDGDFEIVCDAYEGVCWEKDYSKYINCGEYTMIHPCKFSGSMENSCYSPCN